MKYKSIVNGDYYDLNGINHSELERTKPIELLNTIAAQRLEIMSLMKVVADLAVRVEKMEVDNK